MKARVYLTRNDMTLKTYPQGGLVWPREHIKMGRMKASPGQSFWVTNTTLSQQITGVVEIARSGRNMGSAIGIAIAEFEKFFRYE